MKYISIILSEFILKTISIVVFSFVIQKEGGGTELVSLKFFAIFIFSLIIFCFSNILQFFLYRYIFKKVKAAVITSRLVVLLIYTFLVGINFDISNLMLIVSETVIIFLLLGIIWISEK